MSRSLTAVSLFSGCGGFDLGVQSAGVKIIWANDIDPDASAAYRQLFPDVEFVEGDVREVQAFPKADVLVGCYPCTGFSLGSRRRWRTRRSRNLMTNQNNFLFREFLRAVKQVKPRYLFVENVPGMASAHGGWFLNKQCAGFRNLGYKVDYRLLNAAHFGVPQTRKRIFIVGILNGGSESDIEFPEPTHGTEETPLATLQLAIGDWDEWPEGEFFDYPFHGHYLTRNRKRAWDEPSYTVVASSHHVPLHPMGLPMTFVKKDSWKLNGPLNRRLSWRECAAIQGLPAGIDPAGSLSKKYAIIGNAVPPPVARSLLAHVVSRNSNAN